MKLLLTKNLARGPVASVMSGNKVWGHYINGIDLFAADGTTVPVDMPMLALLYGREFELRCNEKTPKVYKTSDAMRSGEDIAFLLPEGYTDRGPRLILRGEAVGLGDISYYKVNPPFMPEEPSLGHKGEQFAIHGMAHAEVFELDITWTIAAYGQQQQNLRREYRQYVREKAPEAVSRSNLEDVCTHIQCFSERLQELWEAWKGLTTDQYLKMDNRLKTKLFVQKPSDI